MKKRDVIARRISETPLAEYLGESYGITPQAVTGTQTEQLYWVSPNDGETRFAVEGSVFIAPDIVLYEAVITTEPMLTVSQVDWARQVAEIREIENRFRPFRCWECGHKVKSLWEINANSFDQRKHHYQDKYCGDC